ncbi:RsmB/NOP family class I SAM-dependent RNA methyltransferase [Flectobacillus sp. BAB-3569]|uniref:RsmB/NOP family class I SAM-dependent RNA methyltransferase n=1 Tax=Flectobacillus sp. BAB-3569 TaxID=1509483 RepID=UPI000BA489EB|nr:RsmB/NOP family class I SAM-dependent RNA methyltransferase [Flectobacillus sp. BAB-3569]PAC32881.1 RNA methyltransferase [Flectobacillus sp. BAB-3569]
MRIHRPLADAVVGTLQEIFLNKRQADRAIEYVLKSNRKWGSRDRGFIAENTYEIVRWWRMLHFVIEAPESLNKYHFWQAFGAWQLLKAKHANSDEALFRLPDWVEFSKVNTNRIFSRYEEAKNIRKIIESVPDWLDTLGEAELGTEKWNKEIHALNQQAPVILRVNSLKSNREHVADLLGDEDINADYNNELPDGLILEGRPSVFKTSMFKDGFFEVQDAASQLVAPMLDVKAGMRVIDACAGAGGKTLHIAALMENKGRIIAMDVEERKLQELQKRARRAGAMNLETRLIEPKTIKRLQESADRLLLDVPCSGLGVIRRNPDAKWKLTPEFIENLRTIQYNILTQYSSMLKKGGKMVFATCSLLPSESEDHVRRFLAEQGEQWELLEERRTSPAEDGYDGFYMACLQRK